MTHPEPSMVRWIRADETSRALSDVIKEGEIIDQKIHALTCEQRNLSAKKRENDRLRFALACTGGVRMGPHVTAQVLSDVIKEGEIIAQQTDALIRKHGDLAIKKLDNERSQLALAKLLVSQLVPTDIDSDAESESGSEAEAEESEPEPEPEPGNGTENPECDPTARTVAGVQRGAYGHDRLRPRPRAPSRYA